MAATFLARIKSDYPSLRFIQGRKFAFRPPRTVVIPSDDPEPLLLLHEMGHALSFHRDFKTEVGRLKMEVEAWEKARELCALYGVLTDEELIESELDTYRDWLHQKSRCPLCGLTRFQTPDGTFYCPKCDVS
ncbi:MAG: TFIIB-type zinc finger domain-containing protein [Candidatus Saccharibacteria bacterium]|nr:TFIIB-type zinc finger domain-containing protein [Candidatus Saccharibacteria bacterium]